LTAPTSTRSRRNEAKIDLLLTPRVVLRKRLSAASKTARKSHGYSRSLGLDVHMLTYILVKGQ